MQWDTFEVTRQYARCTASRGERQRGITDAMPEARRRRPTSDAAKSSRRHARERGRSTQQFQQIIGRHDARRTTILHQALGARLADATEASPPISRRARETQQAKVIVAAPRRRRHHAAGPRGRASARGTAQVRAQSRTTIRARSSATTTPNPTERDYGNADVMGPDAKHGTHVAGHHRRGARQRRSASTASRRRSSS